ncbi:hypothetical protein [Actinoallomurus rhizosphaericola]|nr:hypothetical protein [Actinoallomurus rhizosphaericola]
MTNLTVFVTAAADTGPAGRAGAGADEEVAGADEMAGADEVADA